MERVGKVIEKLGVFLVKLQGTMVEVEAPEFKEEIPAKAITSLQSAVTNLQEVEEKLKATHTTKEAQKGEMQSIFASCKASMEDGEKWLVKMEGFLEDARG